MNSTVDDKISIKTSVVMATYNGSKYITKQMDSIRCQTLPPDEVIICDDCSTDDTCEIVGEYIDRYNLTGWKLIVNQTNKGYYYNFLDGIRSSCGQTIYLADQDDIWDKDKIKVFESIYQQKSEIMMIQSNYMFIDDQDDLISIEHFYHGITQKNGIIEIPTNKMCNSPGAGFTMSFKRRVANTIFENEFERNQWVFSFHDILIGLTATALGKCLLCLDVIDCHRLHDSNATQRAGQKHIIGRTKNDQTTILKRRIKEFEIIGSICSSSEKRKLFEQFKLFNKYRLSLVERHKFRYLHKLIKMRSFYASRLGIVTDVMYSLGLEKLQMYLYRKINQ